MGCRVVCNFLYLVLELGSEHECRDIATSQATLMDMTTNVFCASGMHMPNGTWATFGGNNAVGPTCPPNGANCPFDSVYGDGDGATAVRLLNPCTSTSGDCHWLDIPPMKLQKRRWYPGIEALADGTSVLIGGFTNGGYINRNTPNTDPAYEGGAAEPTYEFWPSRGEAQVMPFMVKTSGLNSYAHAYLLPSGLMFVQANLSTSMSLPFLSLHNSNISSQFCGITTQAKKLLSLTCPKASYASTQVQEE
jgi:hypothetical protein